MCISAVKPMVSSLSEYSAGMRWVGKNLTKTCALGLVICASTLTSAQADEQAATLMQRHLVKLSEQRVLAQELLTEGDESYRKGEFKNATESYRNAYSLISNVPATAELHAVATERYAQAAVEYSTQLVRFGDYDTAKSLLEGVLSSEVAPNNVAAQTALARLSDPIKTNPALTPQITRDAESAGKLLRKAEGFYNLGKYDAANKVYQEVLTLDPYTVAARRGLERPNAQISSYAKAAKDESRSKFLSDVDGGWESVINHNKFDAPETDSNNVGLGRVLEVRGNQLRQTIVPVVDFQDVDLTEAVESIRIWSKQYDPSQKLDADKGTSFVVNLGDPDGEVSKKLKAKRITLNLKNVPLSEVLDYVCEATGTQWRAGDYAVVLTPYGSNDQTIRRRTFKVPPTFMLDAKAASSASAEDEFGSDTALRRKASAKEFLTGLGVTFPEGTSANYIAASSSLIVTNTGANLDLVEAYVSSYTRGQDVQVVMKVTIIETAQKNLTDLGFDWLVAGQSNGGNISIGGGTQGNGFAIPTVSLPLNAAPVTSGLRSGTSLFSSDRLDQALNGTLGNSSRSSGILALSTSDFHVIMRGLSQKGDTSRLDTATLIARSGEKATLLNAREFIYPTEYEPPEIPNSTGSSSGGAFPVTPAHPTAFETRPVGMRLEAEATVSESKHYIDLQIQPTRIDFEGFVNYGSPIQSSSTNPITGQIAPITLSDNEILQPVFKRVELRGGHITVQDGSNFVIAGLTESKIETVEDKIPVVGDIPVLGRLFKSEGKSKVDRVLLMIVNVELLDPTGKPIRDQ